MSKPSRRHRRHERSGPQPRRAIGIRLGIWGLLVALIAAGAWVYKTRFFDGEVSVHPPRQLLEKVRDLNNMARFDEAIALLEAQVQANPTMWDLHLNLGATYANKVDFARAIEHFLRELELNPGSVATLSRLGKAYEHSGDSERALQTYQQWVAMDAQNWEAHRALGEMCLTTDRSPQALAAFARAAELNPDHPASWIGMGKALMNSDDQERARQCFERAVQLDPQSPDANYNLGQALVGQGAQRDGERVLARFRELAQQQDRLQFLMRARARSGSTPEASWEYGEELRKSGKPSEALTEFEATIAKDPAFAPGYVSIATIQSDRADFAGALKTLSKVSAHGTGTFDLYFQEGRAYGHLGQKDKAQESLRKASLIRPLAPREAQQLSEVFVRAGWAAEGKAILRQVLATHPEDHESSCLMGVLHHLTGSLDSAVTHYQRAIGQAPARTRYRILYSMARAAQGQPEAPAASQSHFTREGLDEVMGYFGDLPGAEAMQKLAR